MTSFTRYATCTLLLGLCACGNPFAPAKHTPEGTGDLPPAPEATSPAQAMDNLARAMRDRDKIKKRERAFKVPTHITFDNDGSDIYTIIEVDTRDRPGLLYDLARSLAEANIYIASAVVATYGEQAVDTFYVKDMFGLKYHSESKQASLERKLREAIAAGTERAEG